MKSLYPIRFQSPRDAVFLRRIHVRLAGSRLRAASKRLFSWLLVCVWLLAPVSRAWAQNLTIVNAGFESNSIPDGAFVVLQPQAWATYDPNGMINNVLNAVGVIRPNIGGEYFPTGAPEGVNAALVFLGGNQTGEAGLQQTLTATLQANTRYRCSVQIGNIASGWSLPGSSGGASNYFDLDGFPGYRIDVLAGGSVVATDNNSIGATIPEGAWRPTRFYFDVTNSHPQLGQPLGIRLVNLKQPGTPEIPNIEVDFDAVALSVGAIPGPAQLAISLTGAQPQLQLTGTAGATYRVEASSVLPATNWVTLTNLLLSGATQDLLDPQFSTGPASRFYRAVLVD